jgi:predicted MFS family arabinose efflux permease
MNFIAATRYVLSVRTNLVLIAASALGYYFIAGVQTFGSEFAKEQYRIDQPLANVLLLVIGIGGLGGVLAGGALGDRLLRRGQLSGRLYVAIGAAGLTPVLFAPALFTHSASSAVPYLIGAVFLLSAQNPPLDAARLDIMPPLLWGRAESVRTFLRALAQALAPLLFGAVSDHVFGGGSTGLKWTFVVMLVPLAASAYLLYIGRKTYPRDVATAAASS